MLSKKLLWRLIAFLLTLWWVGYVAFAISCITVKPQNPNMHTDAIVVLTGGNFRLKTGFDLWAQRSSPRIFITGVHPDVKAEELTDDWNRNSRALYKLPECCVEIGQQAVSTYENAMETKEWIEENDIHSIRLVTSKYHMLRALIEFRAALPETEITIHPVTKKDYTPYDQKFWSITFSEYNKVLVRGASLGLSWLTNSSKSTS